MKSLGMMVLASLATIAAPAAAREIAADGTTVLPVAYEALRDGKPQQAIAQLTDSSDVAARDPSRLINLGSAYVQLGRTSDAAAMYQAAADSPIRYDLELADGRFVDSRWAARMALDSLRRQPRVTVAMAGAN